MSTLNPAQEVAYGAVIDLILRESDLDTVSAKKVRKDLAERLGLDPNANKDAINKLIGQRFDHLREAASESASVVHDHVKPARASQPVKPKTSTPTPGSRPKNIKAEDDAAIAARLQDEENRRGRPSRGGVMKKKAPTARAQKAAKAKIKSAAKLTAADDSGLSSGEGGEPKVLTGAFHKLYNLSPALSAVVHETALSRPQVVKHLWAYIKEHELQDPSDRRQIRCNDTLKAVFKQERVSMFSMNKYLGSHLYPRDEDTET